MSLIVQKYGGTSMGSPERIREVAKRVARFARDGHQLVIVPSAMSGETNRLIALAKELNPDPSPRELDVIASTGEQVSIGLLALALQNLGLKAKSYTGWQVPIVTDAAYVRDHAVAFFDERADRVALPPDCHPPASSPFSVGTTEPPTSISDGRSPSGGYESLMCTKLWRPILVPCSLTIET